MWTNMAGLVDMNDITGGYFNHLVPLLKCVTGDFFNGIATTNAQHTVSDSNPENDVQNMPDGFCNAVSEDCTHPPGVPPSSLYNNVTDLFWYAIFYLKFYLC